MTAAMYRRALCRYGLAAACVTLCAVTGAHAVTIELKNSWMRPAAAGSLARVYVDIASDTPLTNARWGHLHLRVTELERSDAFYRAALGMRLTQGSYPGARFLAADDYHHHVGLNTWV